jgi:hypothetical protein
MHTAFAAPPAHWTAYDTTGDTPWMLAIVIGLLAMTTARRAFSEFL